LLYSLCMIALFRWLMSMSRLSSSHKGLGPLDESAQYCTFLWWMMLRTHMKVEACMYGFPTYSMSQKVTCPSAHQDI
jgi:hypothetical protein